MPATVVRGFASSAKAAFSAEEGGMVTYIKGYLKEQLNYAEALVLGSCFAMGDTPLSSEMILFSLSNRVDDPLSYSEAILVTNS